MSERDVLVIGMVDKCPIYWCPHDGQTHEHPRQQVVDVDHRDALKLELIRRGGQI